MDLNNLIEERGEDFVHTRELEIPEDVDNLEGIERFDSLERVDMNSSHKVANFHLLGTKDIWNHVRHLDLKGNFQGASLTPKLSDISFIAGCKVLETLDLEYTWDLRDFSPLDSPNLRPTLRELRLNSRVEDIGFLAEYLSLEKLYVHDPEVSDYSALFSPNLKKH